MNSFSFFTFHTLHSGIEAPQEIALHPETLMFVELSRLFDAVDCVATMSAISLAEDEDEVDDDDDDDVDDDSRLNGFELLPLLDVDWAPVDVVDDEM